MSSSISPINSEPSPTTARSAPAWPFWKKAVVCILGIELLGNASGLITFFSIGDWYASLERPPGMPANGTFGPVWTILFAMMGYAVALVWQADADKASKQCAFRWFTIQFVLNLAWTPLFFGIHRIDLALVVIVMLLAAIFASIRAFKKVNNLASWLLVPYLVWTTYATYLNAGFWWLNR
ncbi:MAG: TspO/MBR family protein [Verrucomicrobiota bacterium]